MRQPRRPSAPQRGSSIIEFALIAPAFLLLLFGAIELGLMFWVNITMQHAVREGARYAITGQSGLDPDTADPERYRAVVQAIKDNSMGLFDKAGAVISVNNKSYADSAAYSATMFGQPGDILVLQLDCAWPFATPLMRPFFDDGTYHFSVAATMRNEAFK